MVLVLSLHVSEDKRLHTFRGDRRLGNINGALFLDFKIYTQNFIFFGI